MKDISSGRRRNLEIKARCTDLDAAERDAVAVGARVIGVLEQVDTYFHTLQGRLKLRETSGLPAELIGYERSDEPAVRASDYVRVSAPDPAALKGALSAALGVVAVVRKRRRLLLWQNVRIHLDRVDGLGDFVELEAVIGPDDDERTSQQRLEQIIHALRIAPEDRMAVSYADLVHPKTPC